MEKTIFLMINDSNILDCCLKIGEFPILKEDSILKEAIDLMDEYKLGVAALIDENYCLKGIITDGDIRRSLIKIQKPLSHALVDDAINYSKKNPKFISSSSSLFNAVKYMNENKIWDLPVLKDEKIIGLLHLHSAINKLIIL